MPKSNGEAFYLTNDQDSPPLVHAILEPSSRTWQYIVVDPNTRHGVIIDPVQSQTERNEDSKSEKTEDIIIRLIKSHQYLIDHIFETESSQQPKLTAAWSLRMQLSESQGYPPQLCRNSSVTALKSTFARKYGASNGFTTTLNKQHADRESILVGRMRVTVMHVPGHDTPNRRAYLIDGAIFGAYSIALPGEESAGGQSKGADPVFAGAKDDEQRRELWKSMIRVLSLPEDTRVYHEEDVDGTGIANCTSIGKCRTDNPYIALSENEFIVRRRGELKERENAKIASSKHSKKRSKHMNGP